jgi:signal transduction histidine kinase
MARRPLHPDLVLRLDANAVIAAPLPGETLHGWLFFLDKRTVSADDLGLSRIVSGIVASRLDLHYLLRRLRDSAATEERIRLARDLHDGVMQSLTGIALRLAALQRQVAEEPRQALQSIEETRRLIVLEQQDLRFFIEDLKPPLPGSDGEQRTLKERLEALRTRVEQEWNLEVELPRAQWDSIPDALAREIYFIVREALVNSVRHGNASRVTVRATDARDGCVGVEITDNGRGFPFEGTLSQKELASSSLGPRSICERVAGLHGVLTLDSGPSGARLIVELPLASS